MTSQERDEIFAKEYLSIDDFQKLFGINDSDASRLMNDFKKKLTVGLGRELRWSVRGKMHVQDYLDAIEVKTDRYKSIIVVNEQKKVEGF